MKTSIEHLPQKKQVELKIVVNMIREEFDVDVIILFGSYARGDWVEELGPDKFYYNYQSDFDILVVADRKYVKKHHKWNRLEDRVFRSSVVTTPVVRIHHSIGYLNDRFSIGHYFFTDIIKKSDRRNLPGKNRKFCSNQGVNLYESYFSHQPLES